MPFANDPGTKCRATRERVALNRKLGLWATTLACFVAATPSCVPDVSLRSSRSEAGAAAVGGSGSSGPTNSAGGNSAGGNDGTSGGVPGGSHAGGSFTGGAPPSGGTSPHDASSGGGRTSNGNDGSASADSGRADATPNSDARSTGSTCEGGLDVCSPSVCQPAAYNGDFLRQSVTSTVIADVGAFGVQNILSGASSDGNVIMEQRWCGGDGSTWLYDGDLATRKYTGTDITAELGDVGIGEGQRHLEPDGLTVVAKRLDGPGFTAKRRANRSTTSFSAPDASAFTEVNDWASAMGANLAFPATSFDGLAFYFNRIDPPRLGTVRSTPCADRPSLRAPVRASRGA